VLMQGELPWAMAKDGVFPAWLAKLSRYGTPARAHILASLLLTIVMAFNYTRTMADLFGFLILLATTASLVAYFVCSLAAVKLGVGRKSVPIFLAAALFSLWAIWGSGFEAMAWGLLLLLSGVPLYFLMRWRAATPAAAAPAAPPGSSA
jgi:basic amino acid/polyamine antiporter, APA family